MCSNEFLQILSKYSNGPSKFVSNRQFRHKLRNSTHFNYLKRSELVLINVEIKLTLAFGVAISMTDIKSLGTLTVFR